MTANASWSEYVGGSILTREPSAPQEPSRSSFLREWETWVTFALVMIAFVSVAASIEEADWVPEMPSLFIASLVGLVTAFLFAHAPVPAPLLHLVALGSGLAVTLLETMQTMRLADATLSGVQARWNELWARLDDWGIALVQGDISTDPLPFVLLVVFSSWLLSYLAAWSVFRWHNAWLAVIPGGIALLTNISYLPGQPSLAFIVYLFAAVLLVTRVQLLRAQERWREEQIARPPFLSLEVLNFATWIGLALIIASWIVPTANHWGPVADIWQQALSPVTERIDRIGRVFIGIDAKRANLVHKFGDVLPLQGRVTLHDEPLFSVEAPADVPFLRAAAYDEYTGRGWRIGPTQDVALVGTSVDAASFGTPATRAQFRRPIVVTVHLTKTLADRRLLSPGEPLATDIDASLLTGADPSDVLGLVPAQRVRADARYAAVGTVSAATVERLARSGLDYPAWVSERYLQLPDSVSPEVALLARNVAGESPNPYGAARRIEQYLRSNYPYDLDVPDPSPLEDGVSNFLFSTKRGYFDQHASAMAVMLRSIGIPARVAVGFALDPGDRDPKTNTYIVSDMAAWTWPEVYFEGLGWVEFNPTPGRPTIARPGDDSQFAPDTAVGIDDFDPALGLLFDDFEINPNPGPLGSLPATEQGGSLTRIGRSLAALLSAMIVLGTAVLLAGAGVRLWWEYRFRGLRPAARRWARLQQLASWAGAGQRSTLTPIEAARAIRSNAALDLDVESLARAYTRERYGRDSALAASRETEEEREAFDATYASARNALLRMGGRRLLPWRRRRARQTGLAVR